MDIKLKNGRTVKIMVMQNNRNYEYYLNGVKIGVYDPNSMKENFLMLQNTLEKEWGNQIKDGMNAVEKSDIQKEAEKTKEICDYANKMGIEKVRNIYEIEILRDKDTKRKPQKDDKEEKSEISKYPQSKQMERQKTKVTDMNGKQEVELSERANDFQDLRKWLGGKIPPEFTKLIVIDSNDMSEMKDENGKSYKRNSTRYDLAIVDNNNQVEPLRKYVPELQQRVASGNNSMEQKYQVDTKGRIEKSPILSEYELGKKVIQVDNKEHGRVEVNVGREEHSGKQTMGRKLRDSNSLERPNQEVNEILGGEYESNIGERKIDENLKEIGEHEKSVPSCKEEHTIEDGDGNPHTTSHGYITEEYIKDENGKTYTYEDLARRWGKFDKGKLDAEGTKEWIKEQREENLDMKIEDLIERGDEEHEDPRAPEHRR